MQQNFLCNSYFSTCVDSYAIYILYVNTFLYFRIQQEHYLIYYIYTAGTLYYILHIYINLIVIISVFGLTVLV